MWFTHAFEINSFRIILKLLSRIFAPDALNCVELPYLRMGWSFVGIHATCTVGMSFSGDVMQRNATQNSYMLFDLIDILKAYNTSLFFALF